MICCGVVMKKVVIIGNDQEAIVDLKKILDTMGSYKVCDEAKTYDEGYEIIKWNKPDLAIIDLNFKDDEEDFDLISKVSKQNVKMLIISNRKAKDYARRSIEEGAYGYIMKTATIKDVRHAIKAVTEGTIWVNDKIVRTIIKKIRNNTDSKFSIINDKLNRDDITVLAYIGKGMRPRSIAKLLDSNYKTIDSRLHRIRKKLGLKNGEELSRYAIEWMKKDS